MVQLDFPIFDADSHYYEVEDAFIRHLEAGMQKRRASAAEPSDYVYELKDFSDEEIRLVMRENALGLSQRRPA